MVTYYKIGDMFCASAHGDLPYEKTEKPAAGTKLTWLFTGGPGSRRASFLVNHPAELFMEKEDVSWLNTNRLNASAYDGQTRELPADLLAQLDAGTLRAVNASHPKFEEILAYKPKEGKKRVHVLAIGDVGSMLLTGLHLLGGDVISSIGICDISDKVTARWEFEENQIAYPWDYDAMPEVDVVDQDHLFDCDVFVFVASKGIPPVGSGVKDVRMYQFENNSKIIGHYAKMAREKNFKGLFCAVSDPVDPLAKTAFLESNKNEAGEYDWMGLLPEQIQGFGLGVMNARAAYYAKRDPRFKQFLTEGRQSLEFDWLWSSYYRDGPLYLLEWELTLRTALAQLGFHMEQRQNTFRLLDREGREQRFDFARGGPAEKLALKLLFPLDDK